MMKLGGKFVVQILSKEQQVSVGDGVQVDVSLQNEGVLINDHQGDVLYQSNSSDRAWMAGDGMLFISLERDSISVLVLRSIDPEAEAALGEVLLQLQGKFDRRTEEASADLYFHYYSLLPHQQNMLQDMIRTGTYYASIMGNAVDFRDKVVMDVGAGSGILSLFAAQAGARKVYAVEASNMAASANILKNANPALGARIEVIQSKIEDLNLEANSVDVLISEPMGTLLVNERMLETYLHARDRFLKPGGRMFPQTGRIHVAAFTDDLLYTEMVNKATFWQQNSFFGVDLSSLFQPALDGYFSQARPPDGHQVVVDAIDPRCLISAPMSHAVDFGSALENDLHDIVIPLHFPMAVPGNVHGVACWFDVLFDGSSSQRWLSTAPGVPTTHWFQLRCVLSQPLTVYPGAELHGELRLIAHKRQSYDIHLRLSVPSLAPGRVGSDAWPCLRQVTGKFDLKEPYYRQLTMPYWGNQAAGSSVPSESPAL
ncbi:S-adenosyl-L-methionine-dependent methyltransferase [Coccomyxa subellipsoidea C-169]|uniref:type I protein arginine methyltransferase n=1 Tax=Coccomyxa subellipsoidea (strain C-169) TaxID=574566 RepID=I0YRA3_COCSC|nr:S-adenosyl-L-methionine-dependent methyltransferase [Coccomyxa subellipsoidea C-169]EIE20922.1 S-adenosyl-L-methionine-dependent methyltransferase [Coccomyxa subellipsoidea C-169]|eukprot:XP_005645466.1 S-adenosyl-L-methionine-dependent methyltransferase [Coccomyxa subellipsoidea C-169]